MDIQSLSLEFLTLLWVHSWAEPSSLRSPSGSCVSVWGRVFRSKCGVLAPELPGNSQDSSLKLRVKGSLLSWKEDAGAGSSSDQLFGLRLLRLARDWTAQPVLGDGAWVGRDHSVHPPCAKVHSVVLVCKRGREMGRETQPTHPALRRPGCLLEG